MTTGGRGDRERPPLPLPCFLSLPSLYSAAAAFLLPPSPDSHVQHLLQWFSNGEEAMIALRVCTVESASTYVHLVPDCRVIACLSGFRNGLTVHSV